MARRTARGADSRDEDPRRRVLESACSRFSGLEKVGVPSLHNCRGSSESPCIRAVLAIHSRICRLFRGTESEPWMLVKTLSAALFGIDAYLVDVEVDLAQYSATEQRFIVVRSEERRVGHRVD